MDEPTIEQLVDLAAEFALKRKAFLAAHKADYNSDETREAYDAACDTEEELMDAIRSRAMDHPDWLFELLSEA